MKKIIAVILALALVASFPVFASADSEKTDRRGSFEFTELFVSRLAEFARVANADYELNISKDPNPYASDDGSIYYFNTSVGTLLIDSGDLSLYGVDLILRNEKLPEDENAMNVIKSVIAISALECNQSEDEGLAIVSKYQGGPESAMDIGLSISNEILNAVNSGALKDNSEVLVYSGNYDYYISRVTWERPSGTKDEFINLSARSRQ